jgi:hypothetical protein|tara:strand:- start:1874 stop:2131 length:258 start_codon:yes stop_codon:yes gene_type:complete
MSVGLKEYLQASDILTEAPASKKKLQKQVKNIEKAESNFRLNMYEIAQSLSSGDNKNTANKIIKSYQQNVTKFMREFMALTKRIK